MDKKHVIVVGGGAAGMMAAIVAKRLGTEVTLLEKNARVGKKILATGNGRCNFSNLNTDVSYYHGNNPKFIYPALANLNVTETLRFFEKLGITPKVEALGKVFPQSEQASSILDVFLYELQELGVKVICEAYVKKIHAMENCFSLTLADGKVYTGDRVILTPGGKAMPSSGSDGNGYALATQLGHRLTPIFPALVQLKLVGPYFKRLSGVKIVGTAAVMHGQKVLAQDQGELLFTDYGISGPPILQISRKAGELLNEGKEAYLKLTLMDALTEEELKASLNQRFEIAPKKSLTFSLVGFIHKRLIPVLFLEVGIDALQRPVGDLTVKEREQLCAILQDWRFPIRGTRSWQSAQVTAGGVDTKEIKPNTMESKLVKGLYFAGEILDIDGQCGGFNLQWAWSSGYMAGQNAAG